MLTIDIPGRGQLEINHVVFDYNGTIACDGKLIDGVKEGMAQVSDQIKCHVITADTFGCVKQQLLDMDIVLTIISDNDQAQKKLDYIQSLGPAHTICVGNGANDEKMLKESGIGIAVLGDEGLALSSISAADLMVKNILDVFAFFRTPQRLIASLRT